MQKCSKDMKCGRAHDKMDVTYKKMDAALKLNVT